MTLVLGIETSCDETALALLEGRTVRAEAMASQVAAHALFGGVVPELASREHLRCLGPLLDRVLAEAGVRAGDLDAVAVARGPGLLGSLLVGVSLAKGLALATGAALVGVNHLEAHLLAPALDQDIPFPCLGLLVSGGHTQLYLMRSATDFEVLGRTLDDAAGEAFDKAAKSLNLPYPGGKVMDDLARLAEPVPDLFPRAYVANDNLDFSFSGLKTAMAQYVAAHPDLRLPALADPAALEPERLPADLARVCASYNLAVADTLRIKVERALDRVAVRGLVAAGGVAANAMLRRVLAGVAERRGLPLILPPPRLCTDNGVMVALAGRFLFEAGLVHGPDLEAIPRGRAVPRDFRTVAPAGRSEARAASSGLTSGRSLTTLP
ncbi:MAG: tRNA (adenosine(37)-N6)-threonylcarbamoyltransferase complex transferase subunit TsaD [Thermodesulfobacteriota bacterium]